MRLPAAAIAWEFRQRHRWGWMAVAAYVLALVTIRLVVLEPGGRIDFESAQSFALAVVVPMAATFLYFLAVFSFGLAGDLAARQSIYPARMFAMPITTAALAGWPMLYGSMAMALLWMVTRLLGVWPSDVDIPLLWPMLLGPAVLAWLQALTWMPYPLPGLRVIVTVLWLMVFDAVVMVALELKADEAVMMIILAPQVPLAYLMARFAVAKARRGDVPDWSGVFARPGEIADAKRREERFLSPERAQLWFEWRQHGRSLPAIMAILLPFELALLFLFSDTPVIVFEIMIGVLLTPPFMATFVAATVSKSHSPASDSYGLTPFDATRPLTNASLIAAKLKATLWSTLAAWLLVLVASPLALRLSGTLAVVTDAVWKIMEVFGPPRGIALLLLGLMVLVLSTWKQLVQSLYIGMSGREWIIKGSVFLALLFLAIVFPLGHWILNSKPMMAALFNSVSWILAVLVGIKLSAAAWIDMRLYDRRLLSDRSLVIGAACWSASVFALYGLLRWMLPAVLFRSYFLALIAILTVPLARLSAAPLALVWSRHR